jgi:hypothetical protein
MFTCSSSELSSHSLLSHSVLSSHCHVTWFCMLKIPFNIRIYQHSWLTPCSWVHLKRLWVPQPVKKFPAFYWTQRVITVFMRTRHWALSWVTWIQLQPHTQFKIHFNIIFPFSHSTPKWPVRFVSRVKILYAFLISPCVLYAPPTSSLFYHSKSIWWWSQCNSTFTIYSYVNVFQVSSYGPVLCRCNSLGFHSGGVRFEYRPG